jgi:hypothetical protein
VPLRLAHSSSAFGGRVVTGRLRRQSVHMVRSLRSLTSGSSRR